MKSSTKNRRKALFAIILTVSVLFALFLHLRSNVKPIVYTYCDALITSLGEECINASAADVVKLYEYADFVTISKGEDGKIDLLETNAAVANAFARALALRCENALNALGVQEASIPIGAFTGAVLLSDKGPTVDLDVTFFSSVKCDFVSRFENVGVNQTRHSLFAKLDVSLNTILPVSEHFLYLTNNILVAENVIVGEIPEVYVASESGINYLDLIP